MHFSSDATACELGRGGGGSGQAFNVIGLHYLDLRINTLLFTGVVWCWKLMTDHCQLDLFYVYIAQN